MGIIQNLAGMGDMTEQVIATDLLISAKTGVRNYAVAVSEAITPEIKIMLRGHLYASIDIHEKITNYMAKKGYYNVQDPNEQITVDLKAAETALNIQQNL